MKTLTVDSPQGETHYIPETSTSYTPGPDESDRVYAGPQTPWVRVEIPGLVPLRNPRTVVQPVPVPSTPAEPSVTEVQPHHRWLHAMHLDIVGEFFDALAGSPRPRREHGYLEDARMAREMIRL